MTDLTTNIKSSEIKFHLQYQNGSRMTRSSSRQSAPPEDADTRGTSRRSLLRSGGVALGGGIAYGTATSVATAQLSALWSVQRYNIQNTGWAPSIEALTENPEVSGQTDIAAGVAGAGFLVKNSTAYVHGSNGGLAAVDLDSGEVNWRLTTGSDTIVPEFLVTNQLVGRASDGIYVIDAETGDIDAEYRTGYGIGLGWNGSNRWIAPTSGGEIIAGQIDGSDRLWEVELEGWAFRPAVDEQTRQVYVTTASDADPAGDVDMRNPESLTSAGSLYALNPDSGEIRWEKSRPAAGVCEPVVTQSMVIWAGADGDIRAYDTEGTLQWEYTSDEAVYQTPAVAEGVVLAGTESGQVIFVDAESGAELTRADVGSPVTAPPVAAARTVYVGTQSQMVYAFDLDGESLWDFEVRDPVNSLTPIGGGIMAETDVGYTVLMSSDSGSQGGDRSQRGLFSNSPDQNGFASNPVNLTTLGFLLSVVGIGYQMLQGR